MYYTLSPDSLHLLVPQIHVCYFRGESRSPDDGYPGHFTALVILNFDMPFWNIPKS